MAGVGGEQSCPRDLRSCVGGQRFLGVAGRGGGSGRLVWGTGSFRDRWMTEEGYTEGGVTPSRRGAHLAWPPGGTLLALLSARACSRRAVSSPILVVSSLLLGSWKSSCWPGRTRRGGMWAAPQDPEARPPAGVPPTFPEAAVAVPALDLTPLELAVRAPAVLRALPASAPAVGTDSVGEGSSDPGAKGPRRTTVRGLPASVWGRPGGKGVGQTGPPAPLTWTPRWCLRCRRRGPARCWATACPPPVGAPLGRALGAG